MDECRFCRIVRAADQLLLRDEHVAAFLDHRPVFHGHVLVVPVAHVDTLADLPVGVMAPLLSAVQRVMGALETAVDAQGTFVAVNNRVSQSVPHLHVHVVPRRRGDGLRGFFWPRHPYRSEAERRAIFDRLALALA